MIKQLQVEGQNPDNLFAMETSESGCCGSNLAACEYTATVATASAAFTALTFKDRNGDDKTVTFASASGVANIKAAILAVVEGESYADAYTGGEVKHGVKVYTSGSNTIIEVFGELELVSITNGSGAQSFTKRCNAVRLCNFYLEWAGNASAVAFVYNGTSSNITQPFSNTATQVDTAITALVTSPTGTGLDLVTVVKNTTTSKFEITIKTNYDAEMTLDGVAFARVADSCYTDYAA